MTDGVKDTPPVFTPEQQAAIDSAVSQAVTAAKSTLVAVDSKPEHVDDLRKVWRKTKEHYKAQATRFLTILGGLIAAQVLNDIVNGKDPTSGLTTPRALFSYLVPFVVVAIKQYRPEMEAKAADSAPGVTIVPGQVGISTEPEVVVGVEEVPDGGTAP